MVSDQQTKEPDQEVDTEDEAKVIKELAGSAECGVPFGHFQLYFESIERVTDRRLALNRNNASLSILIAAGLGLIISWAHDKDELRSPAILVVCLLSVLAALFCRWWWRQVQDYKDLNGAKFDVLEQMAKNVVLHEHNGERCSFDPFHWEWRISKARQNLTGWRGRLALGSSWSELVVPKAFLAFFVAVALSFLSVFLIELDWSFLSSKAT